MRVEKGAEVQQELQKTKAELSAEIKRDTRSGHPILTCLVVGIVIILLITGMVGYSVSRTGLVRLPVFTDLFFETPEPTRLITEESETVEDYVTQELSDIIGERALAAGGPNFDRFVSLDITEAAFTATLRSAIGRDDSGYFDVERAQNIFSDEVGQEIYLPLANNDLNNALIIYLEPSVNEDHLLEVSIKEFRIGNFKVPYLLLDATLKKPLNIAIGELNKEIGRYANLESVTVSEGIMNITGNITADVIKVE